MKIKASAASINDAIYGSNILAIITAIASKTLLRPPLKKAILLPFVAKNRSSHHNFHDSYGVNQFCAQISSYYYFR